MDTEKILNRLSFGATAASTAQLEKLGLETFVKRQLELVKKEDARVQEKIENFRFVNEELKGQKIQYLHADLETLWDISKAEKRIERKGRIPATEVGIATLIRAIHSPNQLQELLVHFWHNHFNVCVEADERISITFPLYDKMIRQHCLGNFRQFLEAVAKSQSMLFYLNNASNRASPANENYARELFELHTLGKDYYYNHLYNQWQDVPGAKEGKAQGYIDEDVYEAARAFTGWTVADGAWTEGGEKPNTGEFLYLDQWHDNYQKRILATSFKSNQGPMSDALKVLDILANHEGTAKHICTKLCVRFISDTPPKSIIEKATKTWLQHKDSEDQIKQVLLTIILSPEFEASLGTKLKNPLELAISMFRKMELDFIPNLHLVWLLRGMGYFLFSWKTPTGHPDNESNWLSSSRLLKRWNMMPSLLFSNWHKMGKFDVETWVPDPSYSCRQLVQYWAQKLMGKTHQIPAAHLEELAQVLVTEGQSADKPPKTYGKEHRYYLLAHVICLLLMHPSFQYR